MLVMLHFVDSGHTFDAGDVNNAGDVGADDAGDAGDADQSGSPLLFVAKQARIPYWRVLLLGDLQPSGDL